MNNAKALDLIKKGIEGLLDDIQHGRDPWLDHTDLADEKKLTDEDVLEWINNNRSSLSLITLCGTYDKEFALLIEAVMESEWYEDKYQRAVTEAREGIIEDLGWEKTKKSLMPKL